MDSGSYTDHSKESIKMGLRAKGTYMKTFRRLPSVGGTQNEIKGTYIKISWGGGHPRNVHKKISWGLSLIFLLRSIPTAKEGTWYAKWSTMTFCGFRNLCYSLVKHAFAPSKSTQAIVLIKPVVFGDFVTPIAPNCAKRRHPYSTSWCDLAMVPKSTLLMEKLTISVVQHAVEKAL